MVLYFLSKGVNFLSETVLVWSGEQNISILIDIDVPFLNYSYFIYLYT